METLYHISKHYIGLEATFSPRIPVSQNKVEIELPARICASPSLEQCWQAIKGCSDMNSEMKSRSVTGYYFFVYQFKKEGFIINKSVLDFESTGEHISYQEKTAKLVDVFYVDKYRISNTNLLDSKEDASVIEGISAYEDWQREEILSCENVVCNMDWN